MPMSRSWRSVGCGTSFDLGQDPEGASANCSRRDPSRYGSAHPFERPGHELGIDLVALAGLGRAGRAAQESSCPPAAARPAALRISASIGMKEDRNRETRLNVTVLTLGGGFHGELPDGNDGVLGPDPDEAGQPAQATVDRGAPGGRTVAIPSVRTHGR